MWPGRLATSARLGASESANYRTFRNRWWVSVGTVVEVQCWSVAKRRPSAVRTTAVTASTARRTPGRRSTSPTRATTTAYPLSHPSVIKQYNRPSSRNVRNDACRAGTNGGNRVVKKIADLGLARLLIAPWRHAVTSTGRLRPAPTLLDGVGRGPRNAASSAWAPRNTR